MPTVDGAETLRFVRQLNPNVKVVAVTGMELDLLPEAFRVGVDAFLHKPFEMKQLIETVNRLLAEPHPPAAPAGPSQP